MYLRENSMLPEAEQQRLLFEGGYPVLAKVAKRKGLPYPHVNQQGEIEADADWWLLCRLQGKCHERSPVRCCPTQFLTGVGAALSNKLAKINLHTVQDLLLHLPLRYEDRTHLYPIGDYCRAFMPRWKAKC